jgi:thymidylate synthase
MNSLDIQYQNLLQTILDFGVEKSDRTGTGTKSIFGYTIRHSMKEGFPLLTTKKMHWKSIVTELIWFLRGDTNIKFLVDNGCHIWDGDCFSHYQKEFKKLHYHTAQMSKEEFINRIKTDDEFAKKWGDLGPIYGKQWRNWNNSFAEFEGLKGTDQLNDLIHEIKANPDSRRLMVSSWNVSELQRMVLPPCHYGFQVYTRELSLEERKTLYNKNYKSLDKEGLDQLSAMLEADNTTPRRAISLMWNQRSVDTFLGLPFNIASYGLLLEILAKEVNMVPDQLIGNLGDVHLYNNHIEQAKDQIGRDLTCDERIDMASKDIHFDPFDFGVGLSASDESIHNICDLYGVPRRTRQPFELPTLKMPDYSTFEGEFLPLYWLPSDFEVENYQSHPSIKAPLSN